MLERWELFIGQENLERVKQLHVLIVGVGGVGGAVVEALTRSGVEHLYLIDYDVVSESNKNRQIIATDDTIGQKKVSAFQERIRKINPNCQVEAIDLCLKKENIEKLNSYPLDFIVDACDTISTKETLLSYSLDHQIPLISSMGTGKRLDPSKLEIMDLRKTSNDPLARRLRKYVKDNRIRGKIPVVCSTEPPQKREGKTIPSSSFVPPAAGLLIASYIIRQTIK